MTIKPTTTKKSKNKMHPKVSFVYFIVALGHVDIAIWLQSMVPNLTQSH